MEWGEQNHPDGTGPDGYMFALFYREMRDLVRSFVDDAAQRGTSQWAPILLEEVFEALAEGDPAGLRRELVQVAAVAVSWIEAIDRRTS